jgi:hypothetical protein
MSKSLADQSQPSTHELRLTRTEAALAAAMMELLERERIQRHTAFAEIVSERLAEQGYFIPREQLRINLQTGEIGNAIPGDAGLGSSNGIEVVEDDDGGLQPG